MKNPWSHLLLKLWKRQHGKYHFCSGFTLPIRILCELDNATLTNNQRAINWKNGIWLIATVEHLTPRQNGGKHNTTNCVMACLNCNLSRNKASQRGKNERKV